MTFTILVRGPFQSLKIISLSFQEQFIHAHEEMITFERSNFVMVCAWTLAKEKKRKKAEWVTCVSSDKVF